MIQYVVLTFQANVWKTLTKISTILNIYFLRRYSPILVETIILLYNELYSWSVLDTIIIYWYFNLFHLVVWNFHTYRLRVKIQVLLHTYIRRHTCLSSIIFMFHSYFMSVKQWKPIWIFSIYFFIFILLYNLFWIISSTIFRSFFCVFKITFYIF